MRPITVEAEFTCPLEVAAGKSPVDLECCATVLVMPGDRHEGPYICGDFRNVAVDCGHYSREEGRHIPDWVAPYRDIEIRILNWLRDGNADNVFTQAALDAGGYADYRRDLMAAQ